MTDAQPLQENPLGRQIEDSSGFGTAALGGGGIGTIIIALVQLIPSDNQWRTVLVMCTPAVSAGIIAFWKWVSNEIIRKRKERLGYKTKDKLIHELNSVKDDPEASENEKQDAIRKLALINDAIFEASMRKIREI
jgi:hypothetical protein